MSTHRGGHHNNSKAKTKPTPSPRDKDYKNRTGHGVGARSATVHGAGRTKIMPFLNGEAIDPTYRRPPCLDEHDSYHWWDCDRQRCRSGDCDAWCDRERHERQRGRHMAELLKAI